MTFHVRSDLELSPVRFLRIISLTFVTNLHNCAVSLNSLPSIQLQNREVNILRSHTVQGLKSQSSSQLKILIIQSQLSQAEDNPKF